MEDELTLWSKHIMEGLGVTFQELRTGPDLSLLCPPVSYLVKRMFTVLQRWLRCEEH